MEVVFWRLSFYAVFFLHLISLIYKYIKVLWSFKAFVHLRIVLLVWNSFVIVTCERNSGKLCWDKYFHDMLISCPCSSDSPVFLIALFFLLFLWAFSLWLIWALHQNFSWTCCLVSGCGCGLPSRNLSLCSISRLHAYPDCILLNELIVRFPWFSNNPQWQMC